MKCFGLDKFHGPKMIGKLQIKFLKIMYKTSSDEITSCFEGYDGSEVDFYGEIKSFTIQLMKT